MFSLKHVYLGVLIGASLTACAELKPVSVPIEVEHVSHASQHFGSDPTNYGYDAVSIGLKWRPLPYATVVVSEGYVIEGKCTHIRTGAPTSYGALVGNTPEVTTARFTFEIPIR